MATHTSRLPIFPLSNVLFPDGLLALRIFEPRYVAMIESCLRERSPFGVCLIRAGYEVGTPAIPCTIGCTAQISACEEIAPARYSLTARGEARFRIISREALASGLIVADVEYLQYPPVITLPAQYAHFSLMLERVIEHHDDAFTTPHRLDDAEWVSQRVAELLPVTPERRQRWLECDDVLQRLADLERVLQELQ